jgi:hypothetical protein
MLCARLFVIFWTWGGCRVLRLRLVPHVGINPVPEKCHTCVDAGLIQQRRTAFIGNRKNSNIMLINKGGGHLA